MDAFWEAAQAYCDVIDRAAKTVTTEDENAQYDFMKEVYKALLSVMREASRLQPRPVKSSKPLSNSNSAAYENSAAALTSVLKEQDVYHSVFDPYAHEDDSEILLSNDLAEIYEDLREGLGLRDSDEDPDEIEWNQWFAFWNHWGNHASDAVKTLGFKLQG